MQNAIDKVQFVRAELDKLRGIEHQMFTVHKENGNYLSAVNHQSTRDALVKLIIKLDEALAELQEK